MIIVGITGTIAAGKGVVVDILKELGFRHYSVREFITQEVVRRGLPVNRDNLVAIGNELRATHGPGYLAEKLYEQAALAGENCVIESIRTLGEVAVLRAAALKTKGRFYLFAIDADQGLRYGRVTQRGSSTDLISFEQFQRDEAREMESDDPNKQNLKACIGSADYRFTNNSALSDLKWQVNSALRGIFQKNETPPSNKPPGRSLLTKDMIFWHRERGNIFIDPFIPTNLKTTSYDVRLGTNFFQEQPFRSAARRIFNPFDPDDVRRYWGEPQETLLARDWMKENGLLKNIKREEGVIIWGRGETILAHTEEFIGGRNCVTTEMRARSSMGRIGITVCKCAGWGDLGFCNRWTMEMTNHLKETSVVLVAGMRVAQIAFYQVDPLKESYSTGGGQYQVTDDTEEMKCNWSPYAMLPKFSRENY